MTLDQAQLAEQMLTLFRVEAQEGLDAIESTLLDLDVGVSQDGINALFRALHTIKGSAAMNGLESFSTLAHTLEGIYDQVRAGQRPLDEMLIRLTLAAVDIFRELVALGADQPGAELTTEMAELWSRLEGRGAAAVGEDDSVGVFVAEAAHARSLYWIDFAPGMDLVRRGVDVLGLLEELTWLGEAVLCPLLNGLPELAQMEPDAVYMAWRVALLTEAAEEDVRDVFLFVTGDSRVSVVQLNSAVPDDWHLPADMVSLLRQMADTDALARHLFAAEARDVAVAVVVAEDEIISADHVQMTEAAPMRAERGATGRSARRDTMRVSTARLNLQVDLVGELVIAQSTLMALADTLRDPRLTLAAEQIARLTTDMRDNAMGLRMVAAETLFERFRRLVFDLSQKLGKPMRFVAQGGETELDKSVIDALDEPVLHLIRNCADHGIETLEQRRSAGKPDEGTIRIVVEHAGAEVLLTVIDDGAGIDLEAVRARAVERGLLLADAAVDHATIYNLLFEPGFSTAQSVSDISGRGVGLDAVRRAVEGLRGAVTVDSTPGQGTRFTLRLPLTLGIIEGLLVASNDNDFVLPLAVVEEVVDLKSARDQSGTGRDLLNLRGRIVPFVRLSRLFGIEDDASVAADAGHAVIVSAAGRSVGIVVDRVIGQHQTVIKSLSRMYRDIAMLAGATILGDGSVALILDVMELLRLAEAEERVGVKEGHHVRA